MAGPSPTQRTLKYLRQKGYICAITEHWNAHAKIRQDLFGFIDLLALGIDRIVAIQCTSGANLSARVQKIRVLADAVLWYRAGGDILAVGWRTLKREGRKVWIPRVIRMSFDHEHGWREQEIEL